MFVMVFLISSAFAADKDCRTNSDCEKHGKNFICQTVKTGCPGAESHSTCASLKCVEIKPKK